MRSDTCVIFGAGEYYGAPVVPNGAFVVAADGGLDHVRELGVAADVVIGDFDSLTGRRPTDGERTIALPAEKDDPDMLSALKIGWSHGCRTFHIHGGLGGRIDHTIANIQLMALLPGTAASASCTVTARSSRRSPTASCGSPPTTWRRAAWSPCSP